MHEIVSLNGEWNFLPLNTGDATADSPCDTPPSVWETTKIRVPSCWNKHAGGILGPGDRHVHAFRSSRGSLAAGEIAALGEETEFLFDNFDYPLHWAGTRDAWIGREFEIEKIDSGYAFILYFDAVSPRCRVYINSTMVAFNDDPSLPFSIDITRFVKIGTNRLEVRIMDHEYDEHGRTLSPSGNEFLNGLSGIWQDVRLERRSIRRIQSTAIVTSFRKKSIEIRYEIFNGSDQSTELEIITRIYPFRSDDLKGLNDEDELEPAPSIDEVGVVVKPGDTTTTMISTKWLSPHLWSNDDPFLYLLESNLVCEGTIVEKRTERFGFREVWIAGRDILLNGVPVRLFSDWGHKAGVAHLTAEWIRSWYTMMRDGGMNHSRLHSHPHPGIFLDIADEMGILITDETAIFGAGGAQAADADLYWERATEHIRRLVARDRNHPSVIMWSVENEMRWNRDETRKTVEMLPELRTLFNHLDPSRVAYHDGDSSLWNEKRQPVVSRHYGKECTGLGWWDREVPLHSGEMSLYHYAGPNNTVHVGDDEVWSDYRAVDRAAATDTAMIVEDGRSNGVCCFGPWNISCHQNFRLHETHIPEYENLESPGMKPVRIAARTSEFEYWNQGPHYHPQASFEIQKNAFRPFACIDRSRTTGVFCDMPFRRTIHLVNDTARGIAGELVVRLSGGETELERRWLWALGPGEIRAQDVEIELPGMRNKTEFAYLVEFGSGDTVYDSWRRTVYVYPNPWSQTRGLIPGSLDPSRIGVHGNDELTRELVRLGAIPIRDLSSAPGGTGNIVVIAGHSIEGTADEKRSIATLLERGTGVILLEQDVSLFPELPAERKIVQAAFPRARHHPLLEGIEPEELRFWGDDAYGNPQGSASVARTLYRKDSLGSVKNIIDSGEGNFGDGDLEYVAVFETVKGGGLLVACQLKVQDAFDTIPAATRLFGNMLYRCAGFAEEPRGHFVSVDTSLSADELTGVLESRKGAVFLVEQPTVEQCLCISELTGIRLETERLEEVYQIVREQISPIIDGVSNWDTCGIETYCYSPEERSKNTIVADIGFLPAEGLTPLFVTPTRSCGKELFVYGGRTELLRSYTVSSYYASERRHHVVVGSIRWGVGSIILSYFHPMDTRGEKTPPRFARLINQIALNAGRLPGPTLFDSDLVPDTATGTGAPSTIRLYEGKLDERMIEDMRERTISGYERMASTAMLAIPGWRQIELENGGCTLENGLHAVYYTVYSEVPRKNVETNLAIPNPEALTNLVLTGTGAIECTINGRTRTVESTGEATIADIALERGFNYVLIVLRGGGYIRQRWRTTMGVPERSFVFG